MSEIDLSPPASSLIESIRSIGYSFPFAVADLIDNSISKDAKKIYISVARDKLNQLTVSVSDNGLGMDPKELQVAMSLGGKGPSNTRDSKDMGRFGLGLKTASFSQARVLTVISRASARNDWYGISWDLDHVIRTNKWFATELGTDQCFEKLTTVGSPIPEVGTVVIWNSCDRLEEGLQTEDELSLHVNREIENLQKILSLVYHKLLKKRVTQIYVNGLKLEPMDPFCADGKDDESRSQLIFEEPVDVNGAKINVRGYLLPHQSRMGGAARESKISIGGDHAANQGLYLYRVDRLIAWGSWQSIVRKSEANKLARVDISFGNDADELWKLDIKKSTAILPAIIKARIRDLIRKMSIHSSGVFERRLKMRKTSENSVWCRYYDRDSQLITYEVDRSQPVIQALLDQFGENADLAESLLEFIESTFPADLVKNDLAIATAKFSREDDEEVYKNLLDLASQMKGAGINFEVFKNSVVDSYIYGLDQEVLKKYLEKIRKILNESI